VISFLSPLFLAGAVAAAVPIVLHLLKREPEARIKFSTVKLLKQAPVEHTEKHRLRELLLLALRIATLVLLALAFARPFFPTGTAATGSGATVVALDTSYSMTAPGRFERAKQLARDAIDRTGARDLVGVVTFADEAQIAAKLSEDRVLAASAIGEATATFGATRYRTALSAAVQALGGRPGTIVIVTDLQESGWDAGDRAGVPEGTRVAIADVGPLPANLAVVAVQPLSDRLVATIRNSGPRARDVRAHLAIDGKTSGDVTASVGANQSADVIFAGAPRGSAAAVSIDDPDGLQADNIRYAVIGRGGMPTVGVVTGAGDLPREAFYVEQALGAGGAQSGYQAVPLSGAKLASMTDQQIAGHVALLLLSTRGLERHGRELLANYVTNGGGLFIAAGADVDGDVIADALGRDVTLRITAATPSTGSGRTDAGANRALAPADLRHPMFRPFASNAATLGLVTFRDTSRIGGSGCQTVARFTTGEVAAIDCAAGEGRGFVLASDLDNRWNDFPLHATFVPFLHEAVRYLGSGRAHVSELLVADAPAGVARRPGVVPVADHRRTAAPPRSVAINVDPREGDPARLTAQEFQSAVTPLKDTVAAARAEARQQEDHQHLWQYALALMVLTLMIEGYFAARTA
jgi:hypothetical protein